VGSEPQSPEHGTCAARHADAPAWRRPVPWLVFLFLTVVGTSADLWTKHAAFSSLLGRPESVRRIRFARSSLGPDASAAQVLRHAGIREPVGAGVEWTLQTNPGVVFGLRLPRWLVGVATGAAILLVGWFFVCSSATARVLHAALGCVLAGALGNLYDRLIATVDLPAGGGTIRRQVRDFINCDALGWPWVYNIADALLVIGLGLLLIHFYLEGRRERKAKQAV
jgi:signal peptidase II